MELSKRQLIRAALFLSMLTYFSADSKETIPNVVNTEWINNRMRIDMFGVAKGVQKHYSKRMELLEIQKLPPVLSKGHSVIFNMMEEIKNLTTTKELLKKIYDCINSLGVRIPKDNILHTVGEKKYFEFLQIVNNNESSFAPLEWMCPFEDVVKYLYESEKWYIFLNDLYTKLIEYEIQKEIHKYNVADIEDWGKPEKSQDIIITKHNFFRFLNKTAEYNIKEYDNVKNIIVTELQLVEINHILNLTLKHRVKIWCKEPYVFITGVRVSIQNIYTYLFKKFGEVVTNENIDLESSCKNVTVLLKFIQRFETINIFALNTIFIDGDVGLINNVTLSFIAPNWEVIGTRKINLDGKMGDELNTTMHGMVKFIHQAKAKDGVYAGNKGEDGRPGLPGGPGGNFFGIGNKFVNGANLTISVNGGMGGDGEDGGNGKDGKPAHSATVPSASDTACNSGLCDGNKKINGFNCHIIPLSTHYSGPLILKKAAVIHTYYSTDEYSYIIYGIRGGRGGDGGLGGKGGKGGYPGSIALFEMNNHSGISMHKKPGTDGNNGRGGMGGAAIGTQGGYDASDVHVRCIITRPQSLAILWSTTTTEWELKETVYSNQKVPSGNNGTDGANARGIQDSIAATVADEPANIINQYKIYLRENSRDRDHFTKHSLTQFLDQLDGNQNVKDVYNTLGLVKELQGLEEQFHMLSKDDLIYFYQSLLNRVSEYAQNPRRVESSSQYKKVLSYLYTTALGKIYNLKYDSESNLIIDIREHLDLVKRNIESLRDLQKQNIKTNIINKYKENYKSSVDKKIQEAKTFIEKQVTPEIETISAQIDNNIDVLINETIVLEERAKREKQELIEKKQQLGDTLMLRGVFSTFKLIGQVISFLGPVGAVAGSVVGAVSSVTESLVLDSETSQQGILHLPPSITSSLQLLEDQIKTAKNKKLTYLNNVLGEISQELNGYPEKLSDTAAKLSDIRTRVETALHEDNFDSHKIRALEDEFIHELNRKETELKAQKVINDKKTESAMRVIGTFKQAAQFASVTFDIYNKYKDDKTKLDVVSNAIEQAEKKSQDIIEYREKIYDTITPMLQSMGYDISNVASKLNTKSQVALDVTKWQVQGSLKDIKLQMQELTKGFKVENNLARCIEKLEEVMITLINIYDRIQNYQEQQNLANYIADVGSAASGSISIADSKLSNALNYLEMMIRSNLVLKQYKTAINALKQWVFPFGHLYLRELILPTHLQLDSNIQNLVFTATTQIENIKLEIDVYQASISGQDKYMHKGEFNSHYVSTKPFYIWKNEQHKNMISKLLTGKVVVVKADIMNSATNKDAIKFSFIEIYLKSQNEIIQYAINNILKGFKMKVTHLGNSYYRYGDQVYVISSDSQTIECSFEKNNVGEPVDMNEVYNKMKEGNLILSPYAFWEIMLINSTSKISFRELEIYKDEVDLQLVGYGSYVTRDTHGSDLMVENYYEKMCDTNYQLDLNIESETVDTNDQLDLNMKCKTEDVKDQIDINTESETVYTSDHLDLNITSETVHTNHQLDLTMTSETVDTNNQLDLNIEFETVDTNHQLDLTVTSETVDTIDSTVYMHHYVQAFEQVEERGNYVISGAAPCFSSPINYISNTLKENVAVAVLTIVSAVNQIFIDTKGTIENSGKNPNYYETSEIFIKAAEVTVEDDLKVAPETTTECVSKQGVIAVNRKDLTEESSGTTMAESTLSFKTDALTIKNSSSKLNSAIICCEKFNDHGI